MKTAEENEFDDKIDQVELEELMYDEFYALIGEAKKIGKAAGYAEATRWRDPKVELPDYYQKVDVKFKRGGVVDYASAALLVDDDGSYFFGDYHFDIVIDFNRVLGWRPIE